jgi:hypothetical protein
MDSRVVTNEKTKTALCNGIVSCLWQDLYVLHPNVVANVKGLYPLCASQLHSLE